MSDSKASDGKGKETKGQKPKPVKGGAEGKTDSSAKDAKELKKKQKAERRAQKKQEVGKGGAQPLKPISEGGNIRKDTGVISTKTSGASQSIEQIKSTARAVRQLREKSISRSEDDHQVKLFSHLHQYERTKSLTKSLSPLVIPPTIARLAILYSQGVVCGSNARCIAMLSAFKKVRALAVIQDYTTPPQKDLSRDLESTIKPYINFLISSRPLSVSMGNAIKWLKLTITNIDPDTPENKAKQYLCDSIDEYLHERVTLADEAISVSCRKGIIKENDTILIYSHSSIVVKSLIDAHVNGLRFKVIVVDSRPKLEGRHALQQLVKAGIACSYIYINAVSYIMKEVSKVMLGAHSVLANGYVLSRVGSATVAMVAKSYNVPVLVCCETYKFSEKVQADAFVVNELGDPNDLVSINRRHGNLLSNWKDLSSLNLLNLTYDVTSPELVAMVITEVGNLPCTSVPVILRLSSQQYNT